MKLKSKIALLVYLICVIYQNDLLCATLTKRLPVYGVVKPKVVSTLVAIGNGILNNITREVGDNVRPGQLLLKVFERQTIRNYQSTIKGTIAKIHVTKGAAITHGMPLVTVVNPSKKYIEVSLSPEEARSVKPGMEISLEGQKSVWAKVKKISPIVDPDTGAVSMIISLAQDKVDFRIGEIISLYINVGSLFCDQVVTLDLISNYTDGYTAEFIAENKVCLLKKK
ncbi:MAG: HlyD family efflux transporter periplasmic adaptor subunit [Bacteriovoracaceae bacterium]|nr:HlyD family efflux transporter periplasmic adaptor subunit [Bacteriovoracaceae bacterium]